MKESKFLAPILLESPLMFEILEKIRDRHSIDKLDPTKDPYKQRVRQDMEQDPPIDWQAVRYEPPPPARRPACTARVGASHSAMESNRQIPFEIEIR